VKKALLVGINSYPDSPLRGCCNDVEDWHKVLTTVGKYTPDHVRAVCDNRADTAGIKHRMNWLRQGLTGPGDEVTFQYSGHGSHVRDRGVLDELEDHQDEILCPVDLDWKDKLITDDYIGQWLRTFPAGVRIIVILDCCHSGTATRDLQPPEDNPHYKRDRFLAPPIDIELRSRPSGSRSLLQRKKIGRGVLDGGTKKKKSCWDRLFGSKESKPGPKRGPGQIEVASLNHVLLSGCRSDQTSADAYINGRYSGAMTYYMTREIMKDPTRPIAKIHAAGRSAILEGGYSQESQLEGPAKLLDGPLFS